MTTLLSTIGKTLRWLMSFANYMSNILDENDSFLKEIKTRIGSQYVTYAPRHVMSQ